MNVSLLVIFFDFSFSDICLGKESSVSGRARIRKIAPTGESVLRMICPPRTVIRPIGRGVVDRMACRSSGVF